VFERSVGEVAPSSRMQAWKAAIDRPVASAEACLRWPTIATIAITTAAIGTNVPNTIVAVEIFRGGFGGGVGHQAGSENSVPIPGDSVNSASRRSPRSTRMRRCVRSSPLPSRPSS